MIIRVAAFVPLRQQFDYICDEIVDIGGRVLVPFGRRQVVAIVTEINCQSSVAIQKLKHVLKILNKHSLFNKTLLKLIHFTSDYYQHPLGETFASALPALLRKDKANIEIENKIVTPCKTIEKLHLNNEQADTFEKIKKSLTKHQIFLIDGVTGSGKTEIYMQLVNEVLHKNKQALILVPEINLTPQLIQRFEERFGPICLSIHSGLTPKKRLIAWNQARLGYAKIIIGTRSSIFIPYKELGIIIVDEEHDSSLKQQEGLKYSARDLACVRSHYENIPLILGSATPSLESLHNVVNQRFTHLRLTKRINNFDLPRWQIVDMRKQKNQIHLSQELVQSIQQTLTQKQQVLIFLNRRGFSTILLCESCGYSAKCSLCDTNLSYFKNENYLRCNQCDAHYPVAKICPDCHHPLSSLGVGTERIEETLTKLFSDTIITRIDRDSTRKKGALESKLTPAYQGQSQILIGTQMLAKGHHFPNVSLVAVLNIDSSLYSIDFRALEKLAQLLIQVSGRAGRTGLTSKVILQTFCPDHKELNLLLTKGYHALARELLKERKLAQLPPYTHIVLLSAEAKNTDTALSFLNSINEKMQAHQFSSTIGPSPAPITKRAGFYRAQLLIQTENRRDLQNYLRQVLQNIEMKKFKQLRWSIDVDPYDIY